MLLPGRVRLFAAASGLLFLCGILLVQYHAAAESIDFSREIFLKIDRQPALDPLIVSSTANNELIVAGSSTAVRSGWAIKLDVNGKVIWTYEIGLLPEDVEAFHAQYFSPRLSGAVGMPDGTTYLCGAMPRPPKEYSPALLIYLDAVGQELSRQLIIPKQRNAHGIARFESCARRRDGLIAVGQIFHAVPYRSVFDTLPEVKEPYPNGSVYWMATIGGDGQIESEAQIQPSIPLAGFNVGPVVKAPDSDTSFVFAVTDSISTELIRADVNGTVEAAKQLAGRFLLVQPVASDGLLQVFGSFSSRKTSVAILLDDRLNQGSRAEGSHPTNLGARVAYRMSDRSLALFGSGTDFSGAYYSRIAHVAPDLKSEVDFALPRDKFFDGGSISTATPTANPGEFAVATPAVARDVSLTNEEGAGLIPGFNRGGALDFVRVK